MRQTQCLLDAIGQTSFKPVISVAYFSAANYYRTKLTENQEKVLHEKLNLTKQMRLSSAVSTTLG